MVNVGGPSRGCRTCIQRKIRCDRQRPICGQCTKSARTCGGFRDATELVFRDQTQRLRSRASSSSRSRQNETLANQGQAEQPSSDSMIARSGSYADSLIRSPKLNAEHGLVHFFANNFTCRHTGTNLFWIPNNFDEILYEHSTRCSVQAVGAMAMARLSRSSYLYREAQKLYGTALLSLSEVWRQKIKIKSEATMIAILFLGFFEVLASDLPTSRQSWMAHLRGLGLVLNQHDEQVQDPVFSARMLMQSRSQVILNALQTKTAVPEHYQILRSSSMSWRLPPIVAQHNNANILLTRLAALQEQACSSQIVHPSFGDLVTLDNDINEWISSYTSSWRFLARPSGLPSKLWWDMRHDQYQTPAMAHVLNKMRAARILLYDLIQHANLSSLLPDTFSRRVLLYLSSNDTSVPSPMIQQLVTDICATIPIYYRPSYAIADGSATESPPALGTTYWLFWPMEVVGAMDSASVELTKWIKQCLERVFETTGILKAQLAAQRMEEKIAQHLAPL